MDNYDHPPESASQLEATIRAAGGYVHPTDELRPRTLEAARERKVLARGQRRVLSLAVAVILAATTSFPEALLPVDSSSERAKVIASGDLHRQAMQCSVAANFDPGWALYEAFTQLRRTHAARLGTSMDRPQTFLD